MRYSLGRTFSFLFFLLSDCGISRFNLLRLDLRHGLSLAVHRLGSGLQNAIYRILSKREGYSRMMLYPCFGRISSFPFSLGCFQYVFALCGKSFLNTLRACFQGGFAFCGHWLGWASQNAAIAIWRPNKRISEGCRMPRIFFLGSIGHLFHICGLFHAPADTTYRVG